MDLTFPHKLGPQLDIVAQSHGAAPGQAETIRARIKREIVTVKMFADKLKELGEHRVTETAANWYGWKLDKSCWKQLFPNNNPPFPVQEPPRPTGYIELIALFNQFPNIRSPETHTENANCGGPSGPEKHPRIDIMAESTEQSLNLSDVQLDFDGYDEEPPRKRVRTRVLAEDASRSCSSSSSDESDDSLPSSRRKQKRSLRQIPSRLGREQRTVRRSEDREQEAESPELPQRTLTSDNNNEAPLIHGVYGLGQEQLRYTTTPVWGRMTSSSEWSKVDPPMEQRVHQLNEEDFTNIFDGDDDMAAEILASWKIEDELVLKAMKPSEISVWRKAKDFWGIPATEIFVDPLHYKGRALVKVKHENIEGELLDYNWGQSFCDLLSQVMCCPAFRKNLKFLRYVLQYALYFRVGNAIAKPDESILLTVHDTTDWHTLLNTVAEEKGVDRFPDEYRDVHNKGIPRALNKKFMTYMRTEAYPHLDFIKSLKQQVKKGWKVDGTGLINQDLKNIIKAWDDLYIDQKDKHFYKMKEYRERYTEEGKNLEKDRNPDGRGRPSFAKYVLRDKRTWILSCRLKWEKGKLEYERQRVDRRQRRFRDGSEVLGTPTQSGAASVILGRSPRTPGPSTRRSRSHSQPADDDFYLADSPPVSSHHTSPGAPELKSPTPQSGDDFNLPNSGASSSRHMSPRASRSSEEQDTAQITDLHLPGKIHSIEESYDLIPWGRIPNHIQDPDRHMRDVRKGRIFPDDTRKTFQEGIRHKYRDVDDVFRRFGITNSNQARPSPIEVLSRGGLQDSLMSMSDT